jgi:hypothetical protein
MSIVLTEKSTALGPLPEWIRERVEDISQSGRWQLSLIVFAYFAIVYLTNRILITSPSRLQLMERIDEEEAAFHLSRSESEGSAGTTTPSNPRISHSSANSDIGSLLTQARRRVSTNPESLDKRKTDRSRPLITLAKVRAGWRYVHAAERLRLTNDKNTSAQHAHALIVAQLLKRSKAPSAKFLSESINDELRTDKEVAASPEKLSILLGEGLRLWYEHEDLELEKAAERQRRAMWLTCVGLFVVLILGLKGNRLTLLLGSVGGFLAPLTLVWQKNDKAETEYATSWGVLLLSPVAGALAAYGGLLLLSFLSDENISVLGEVFRDNSWSNPNGAVALTLALLFGFSGRLFSKLALTAVPYVLPPAPGSEVQSTTTTTTTTTTAPPGDVDTPPLDGKGKDGGKEAQKGKVQGDTALVSAGGTPSPDEKGKAMARNMRLRRQKGQQSSS